MPTIELIEPEEGQEILIGDPNGMHIEMNLSDNVEVKSYKIDIHNNFDHHDHRDIVSGDTTQPFKYLQVFNVNQRNAHIHTHEVKIPANTTPGDYHFMIYCTDKAGNEIYTFRNIKLSTTAEPDVD